MSRRSSGPRLYLGNLPYSATESDIRQFFDGFKVVDVKIVTDRETNRPRGFGFVEVESPSEQKAAIEKLNRQSMGGREIIVSEAKEKERGVNENRDARNKSW